MTLADDLHERLWAAGAPSDAQIGEQIDDLVRSATPLASSEDRRRLADQVRARVHGLGVLDELARDPDVTEIMVNGGRQVWIERRGRLEAVDLEVTPAQTEELARRLAALHGRRIDRRTPYVDVRLRDGARLHAVIEPVAVDGPCLTIRRFSRERFDLEDLADPAAVHVLRQAVEHRETIVAAGGTASGKTTLVNALGGSFDPADRVVTIEDAAELDLPLDHVVRLEARLPSEHEEAIGLRELVRQALRMRPDRIICGEMRGAEAFDLVQALNTGHRGSLTTVHANDPVAAMRRIETMMLLADADLPLAAVRSQLASSIDLIAMVERVGAGRRRVARIARVPDRPADEWQLDDLFVAEP